MLVSIIIPVYNGEKFLQECIAAAINQDLSRKDYEVIVIDDGSTDGTEKICKSFGNEIKYILKKNGGTASALNAGIESSCGAFVKWCSADDVMLPDALTKMTLWIQHNDDENYENTIYYTNYHVIGPDNEFLRDFVEPNRPTSDLWNLFFGNGSTTLIHCNVFEKCGYFDDTLPHSEDYEFWLRCTSLYDIKLKLIPFFTINYRNHPAQLTNTVGGSLDKQIKDSIKVKMI